jgi:hypothetical protein
VTDSLAAGDRAYVETIQTLLQDGPAPARMSFDRLIDASPFSSTYANWLVRIAAATGDAVGATRYAAWTDLIGAGPVAEAAHTGSDVVDAAQAERSPLPPNYPWAVYGRRGLRDLFVDGTLVIVPRTLPGSVTAPASG